MIRILPLRHKLAVAAVAATVGGLAAACGSSGSGSPGSAPGGGGTGTAATLRLGYFPNITHATALVGVQKGFFANRLGSTALSTQTFNAGPAETEALLSGGLDAGYIGPNPAINAYAKSNGQAIRIIAGATSGGAQLVVQQGVNTPADLKGKKIATPQLGNTQDVAARGWLLKNGLTPSSPTQSGDVQVEPTDNATTLQLFKQKQVDGAWLPEPWASRLVVEGGGKVLVEEKTLWPQTSGEFVTTQLIVRTDFLQRYPATVKALLEGQVDTNDWIAKNPAQASTVANDALTKLTGKPLKKAVLSRAWSNIRITNDPIAASLKQSADNATAVGLLKKVDLKGIYDLSLLRRVLSEHGEGSVADAGLAS